MLLEGNRTQREAPGTYRVLLQIVSHFTAVYEPASKMSAAFYCSLSKVSYLPSGKFYIPVSVAAFISVPK